MNKPTCIVNMEFSAGHYDLLGIPKEARNFGHVWLHCWVATGLNWLIFPGCNHTAHCSIPAYNPKQYQPNDALWTEHTPGDIEEQKFHLVPVMEPGSYEKSIYREQYSCSMFTYEIKGNQAKDQRQTQIRSQWWRWFLQLGNPFSAQKAQKALFYLWDKNRAAERRRYSPNVIGCWKPNEGRQ